MATLETAIQLAAAAHSGQQDKAGKPYILHPIRVMLCLQTLEQQIAGILHDTVEDTDVSYQQLSDAGFSAEIISAVRALTKLKGESRVEAARRAVEDPIAREVKLADVKDNTDMSRIPNPTDEDFARLDEYKLVREILLAGPEK